MTANRSHPCPEENVLFTCSTSGHYLRWKIVFSNNHVVYRNIENYYVVGNQYVYRDGTVELTFTVVSTTDTPGARLSSNLFMITRTNNNTVLNNTQVECEDPTTLEFIYYKIPGRMFIIFVIKIKYRN